MNPGQQQALLGFHDIWGEKVAFMVQERGYRKASLISLVLSAGFELWTPLLIPKGLVACILMTGFWILRHPKRVINSNVLCDARTGTRCRLTQKPVERRRCGWRNGPRAGPCLCPQLPVQARSQGLGEEVEQMAASRRNAHRPWTAPPLAQISPFHQAKLVQKGPVVRNQT